MSGSNRSAWKPLSSISSIKYSESQLNYYPLREMFFKKLKDPDISFDVTAEHVCKCLRIYVYSYNKGEITLIKTRVNGKTKLKFQLICVECGIKAEGITIDFPK